MAGLPVPSLEVASWSDRAQTWLDTQTHVTPGTRNKYERFITAFTGFLGARGVQVRGTDFDGRSDYGPFIAQGIPSGGLFTGAEGVKTADEPALWGGTTGQAYDPCYHRACDTLLNVDRVALDRNSDALASVTASYAQSTEGVNGVSPRKVRAAERASERTLTADVGPEGAEAA